MGSGTVLGMTPAEQVSKILTDLGLDDVELGAWPDGDYDHVDQRCTPFFTSPSRVAREAVRLCPRCSWECFDVFFGPDDDDRVRTDQLKRIKRAVLDLLEGTPEDLKAAETGLWALTRHTKSVGFASVLGLGEEAELLARARARVMGELLPWVDAQALEEEAEEFEERASELTTQGRGAAGAALHAAAQALRDSVSSPSWLVLGGAEKWTGELDGVFERVLHWALEDGALVLLPDAVVRALEHAGTLSYDTVLVLTERDEPLVQELGAVFDANSQGPQRTLPGALEVLRAL